MPVSCARHMRRHVDRASAAASSVVLEPAEVFSLISMRLPSIVCPPAALLRTLIDVQNRSMHVCFARYLGREESAAHTPVAATTNDEPRRRTQSINRQHLNETICRLSKPKTISMTQSVHVGSLSQFSQSLRAPTPPVTTPASPSRRVSSRDRTMLCTRRPRLFLVDDESTDHGSNDRFNFT